MPNLFDDKLLQSLHTQQPPLEESDPKKQRQLLETWQRQLEPHWRCSLGDTYSYNAPRLSLKLSLKAEDGYTMSMNENSRYGVYSEHEQLAVSFKDGKLGVQRLYSEPIPISSPTALIELKPRVLERYLMWKSEQLKRKKLLELKTSAIKNTVRQLAQELQFDYQLDTMQTKLVLLVKLDDRTGLNIDIPLKSFQEVLAKLKAAIISIRALYGQGLRFKMVMVSGIQGWTPYVRTGDGSEGLKRSFDDTNEAEDMADDDGY